MLTLYRVRYLLMVVRSETPPERGEPSLVPGAEGVGAGAAEVVGDRTGVEVVVGRGRGVNVLMDVVLGVGAAELMEELVGVTTGELKGVLVDVGRAEISTELVENTIEELTGASTGRLVAGPLGHGVRVPKGALVGKSPVEFATLSPAPPVGSPVPVGKAPVPVGKTPVTVGRFERELKV